MPERVAALVYLDAAIPEDGKSTLDLMPAPVRAALANAVAENGGVMLPSAPASSFNVNVADRAMVDALCTPQPFATLCERLNLSGAHTRIRKKIYVRATGWAGAPVPEQVKSIENDPDWSYIEVPCGHDVMLDAPERLAEILLTAL